LGEDGRGSIFFHSFVFAVYAPRLCEGQQSPGQEPPKATRLPRGLRPLAMTYKEADRTILTFSSTQNRLLILGDDTLGVYRIPLAER